MKFLKTSFIILLISLLAVPCFAEVPMLIEYSVELTRVNPNGKQTPYPPGTYDINFYICTDPMCTDIIWSETHYDIYVSWGNTRGKVEVTLGESTPIDVLAFDEDYWLLVTEERKGFSKIEQLLTDPYGMRSEYSNKAETVYDSETGEYTNLQDIVINNARHAEEADNALHAEEADNADTLDGKHYSNIAAEIDGDIATHTAIPDAHHTKTTSFSELTDTATDAQIPDDITIDYAATAGDADTLDGMHYSGIASEIDNEIAAHTAIPDAHHTKTTSFSELDDAATDAQIPNDITIEYANTAGDADTLDGRQYSEIAEDIEQVELDLNNHKADTSIHHTKTTSFSELSDTASDDQIPDDITINVARRMRALCSHPDYPAAGEMYLNTCGVDGEKVYVYTGSEWKALAWE